jgi:hypothetical protein
MKLFFLLMKESSNNHIELYALQLKTDEPENLKAREIKDMAIQDLSKRTKCNQIHVCLVLLPTEFDKLMNSNRTPLSEASIDKLLKIPNLDIKVFSSPAPTK